jgi:hypothetical protein
MDAEIVLMHLTHNTAHPFATWQRNIVDEDTYWGHYFATYAEAEEDFKDRAVRLHGKVRKPFNLNAHANMVAEGFMYVQHEADFEDDGDAESGPHLVGGPAWDEYVDKDMRFIFSNNGVLVHQENYDPEFEAFIDAQAEPHG